VHEIVYANKDISPKHNFMGHTNMCS